MKSVAAKFRYRLAVGNSCHAGYILELNTNI
nr:MAG TPA: hypothetical protein [Caudoviricetes sp.]